MPAVPKGTTWRRCYGLVYREMESGQYAIISNHEPSERSQWLCYDDSTINIVIIIIIITINEYTITA